MHRRWIWLSMIVAWVGMGAVACGARQVPKPAHPVPSAAVLLQHVNERAGELQSARIRAVMEYYGEAGRVRVREALVVRRPGDVRLETLSPFDSTLSILVTNAAQLTYYDLQQGKAYVGRPTAQNLASLMPLWLAPSDIVQVVLGSIPFQMAGVPDDAWSMSWDKRRGAWQLSAERADGSRMDFWVRHGSWVLAGAREQGPDGTTIWEIRTRDFEPIDLGDATTEVPKRIRFLMPKRGQQKALDISLVLEDYTANPDLNDALFTIYPPQDIVISLDGPVRRSSQP